MNIDIHPHPSPVGVCCIRDPMDPKVWSRTPRNICDALAEVGRLGTSFFGLPHATTAMKLRALGTALRYGRPQDTRRFLHGRAMRRAHARHMIRQMAASGLNAFLHFAGDRYLGLPEKPPGTRHYLLLDSTWRYWRSGSLPAAYLDAVDRDIRDGYHQMDHIFSISEHTKQALISDYGLPPERISVVGTGRGVIQEYTGPKNYADGAILFVAKERFEDKGGALLFEGFKRARQRNPALKLWLVGDPRLKVIAAGEPNVEVFGFLPLPELQALFERAALFAMPAAREPWGLVFLEALACRTPVLGLARGAVPEITNHGRFGFPVADATPAAVADALVAAFADLPRLERMGSEGQAWVLQQFTWRQVADRILAAIDADAARS